MIHKTTPSGARFGLSCDFVDRLVPQEKNPSEKKAPQVGTNACSKPLEREKDPG
jgi:hypothetical protein